jgi:hypothetical protein
MPSNVAQQMPGSPARSYNRDSDMHLEQQNSRGEPRDNSGARSTFVSSDTHRWTASSRRLCTLSRAVLCQGPRYPLVALSPNPSQAATIKAFLGCSQDHTIHSGTTALPSESPAAVVLEYSEVRYPCSDLWT